MDGSNEVFLLDEVTAVNPSSDWLKFDEEGALLVLCMDIGEEIIGEDDANNSDFEMVGDEVEANGECTVVANGFRGDKRRSALSSFIFPGVNPNLRPEGLGGFESI